VFCEACEKSRDRNDKRRWSAGADRGGLLLCQRCGEVLDGHAGSPQLLAKLSQLARFGLAGRPIVARPDEVG
jgi:hypothetical protein